MQKLRTLLIAAIFGLSIPSLGEEPKKFVLENVSAYSDQTGFGFEPDHCFSIQVDEGNYRVSVAAAGELTVKAELRRLMIEKMLAGETRSFIVNVRTPKIAGGGEVNLKPREKTDEIRAWDGKLTLELIGKASSIEIEKVTVPTIYILGDSTVCDQYAEPWCSWGQMFTRFFKDDIAIANLAESGEAVSSADSAGKMKKILGEIHKGDWVMAQFGHNDMKTISADVYKAQLKKWVDQVKEKEGRMILITPVNRYSFTGNTITNSLGAFPDAVRDLAREEGIVCIDLNAMSKTLYEAYGPAEAARLFEHKTEDLSKFDKTHHSPFGAYELAKCVIKGIAEGDQELAKHVAPDWKDFDPSKPDSYKVFKLQIL